MTTVSCGARRVSASRNSTRSRLVAAEREDLLELIDDEQEPRARSVAPHLSQLVERMLSRSDDDLHPLLGARERATREGGREPCSHDRRLAASRRAYDPEQRRSRQARHELCDELLSPEERVGIGDVEARQALERTDSLGGRDVGVDSVESLLEVDHATREVCLGGPQLLAAGSGAESGFPEAAAGLGAKPLRNDLVNRERHALRSRRARRRAEAPTAASPAIAAASSATASASSGLSSRCGAPGNAVREVASTSADVRDDSAPGVSHGVEELLVRGVQIVEDEQDGRRCRTDFCERRSRRVVPPMQFTYRTSRALRQNLAGQFRRETGLTHAPRPGDDDDMPLPLHRLDPTPRAARPGHPGARSTGVRKSSSGGSSFPPRAATASATSSLHVA